MHFPQTLSVEEQQALEQFQADVLAGLALEQKELPSMYFYDTRGCEIYEEIKWLDEYYLPRTEYAILKNRVTELKERLPDVRQVIEYGGGSGLRTETLVQSLTQLQEYLPIDVAQEQLEATAESIQNIRPDLKVSGLLGDFSKLPELADSDPRSRLGFLPGSTIGNFYFKVAKDFLSRIRQQLGAGSHLLIGYDRVKDVDVLLAAYDDSKGVTARFNLNLLNRINRELGGNFDLRFFKHEARFNAEKSRIEMHLVSTREQDVTIGDSTFHFYAGESIHTENSHKYTDEQFARLLQGTGWEQKKVWCDKNGYYALALLG
ncbi:MAG: L-histidine N(alpha)-methyltransferase [Gammaproteobacteria bacterium]|nr:L-histidine N(alpha)-methyltransferase [Gammaproteobacteria bacterium]NNM14431.1 L-histidine N(alpha)-methyltransferase [Gammaproteobacteria bacterium]